MAHYLDLVRIIRKHKLGYKPEGIKTMKLTVKQLKQLIKEQVEEANITNETNFLLNLY